MDGQTTQSCQWTAPLPAVLRGRPGVPSPALCLSLSNWSPRPELEPASHSCLTQCNGHKQARERAVGLEEKFRVGTSGGWVFGFFIP